MSAVLTPRPASTILPLRDSSDGVEVLLVRRNLNSDFVGGAYVFPGGAVDAGDDVFEDRVEGLDNRTASERLGLTSGGLAYYVAALRELYEEAGLLLVTGPAGTTMPADADELARRREDLNARRCTFADVLDDLGAVLDLRSVAYLSHWVTPVGPPRRFDTRFFVVEAPSDQVAGHDEGETVAHRWMRPRDALAAAANGDITMILPTIRNLESIVAFERVTDVLAWAGSPRDITRIEPRMVVDDGVATILLPGDEGYGPVD